MSRLLDPSFKYVPAAKTDISKTIKREIARLKAEREQQERDAAAAQKNVSRIRRQA